MLRYGFAFLFALALLELLAHGIMRQHVATAEQWEDAANLVHAEFEAGDLVVAAPSWVDPVMREATGDLISLSAAGSSDLDAFRRLWVLSIRNASYADAPAEEPERTEAFGQVHVARWTLHPTVIYDFVKALGNSESVHVDRLESGTPHACPWTDTVASGGGLGTGPLRPAQRFVCDPHRDFLWVGATITEDLDLQPRRCIYQAPQGSDPIVVTYEDVPLGTSLVMYGGLYYEHERIHNGQPTHVKVYLNDQLALDWTHRGGDGWVRHEVTWCASGLDCAAATPPPVPSRHGTVRFEVSAPSPGLPSFCWAASTRKAHSQ